MNRYLLFISFIFCMNFVIASPLISNPASLNINIIKGETQNIKMNITNPNNYTLIDIKIEGEFVSSNIIDFLSYNETKEISININVPITGDFVKTLRVIGFTQVNCSSLQSETKEININISGASPKDVEICKISNVKFNNNYGNTIRVVLNDFSVDTTLASGDSHVQNFPNNGNFIYRIEPLIDLGTIKVIDTSQKVHDINDDKIITMNLHSGLQETIIELQLSKTNFNVSHNSIINSFFIIKNTGNVQAEKLQFFGDWLTFDKNNLNVNSHDEKAVNFVIAPIVTDVSQTNKTYIKTIKVAGDNIQPLYYNISIFIEQSNVVGGNISSPEWWIKRKLFCDAFPSAPDCITEPLVIYRDKEIFNCPDILANVSPRHIQESLQECNNLRGDFSQFSNNVKLDMDSLKNTAIKTLQLNNSVSDVGQKVNSFANVFYFVFGLLFLAAIGSGVSYIMILYYKSKKLKMVSKI